MELALFSDTAEVIQSRLNEQEGREEFYVHYVGCEYITVLDMLIIAMNINIYIDIIKVDLDCSTLNLLAIDLFLAHMLSSPSPTALQ